MIANLEHVDRVDMAHDSGDLAHAGGGRRDVAPAPPDGSSCSPWRVAARRAALVAAPSPSGSRAPAIPAWPEWRGRSPATGRVRRRGSATVEAEMSTGAGRSSLGGSTGRSGRRLADQTRRGPPRRGRPSLGSRNGPVQRRPPRPRSGQPGSRPHGAVAVRRGTVRRGTIRRRTIRRRTVGPRGDVIGRRGHRLNFGHDCPPGAVRRAHGLKCRQCLPRKPGALSATAAGQVTAGGPPSPPCGRRGP